jgi:SAM-dependent methyltransferase
MSPLPHDDTGYESERDANARRWDELVAHHVASPFYDLERFRRTRDCLTPLEHALLGSLRGAAVAHLQCHFGLDTLSLARRGAERVVGVDLSENAIATARELARQFHLDDRVAFVPADVLALDACEAEELADPFDTVFASWGVFGWIPDLDLWMAQAARLLRPEGRLVLAEFHPLATACATEATDELRIQYPYFSTEGPDHERLTGSYAAPKAHLANRDVFWWAHPLAAVVTAVLDAGLTIESFDEWPHCWHPVFGFAEPDPKVDGPTPTYTVRRGLPEIPLSYSLVAKRPRV